LKDKGSITIPEALHQQLGNFFKEYIIIGGLPAVVNSWRNEQSLSKVNQIHHDLIYTYRDDFAKYSGRLPVETLDKVMISVTRMLGQKFVYSRVSTTININSIKNAINLLNKARISHSVKQHPPMGSR
jgi:uncharacterized protein